MTNRLWENLENEFKATNNDYIEINTEHGIFIVEPVYNCDNSQIIDFIVYHGNYWTNTKEEPNIWFWEEIEKNINF